MFYADEGLLGTNNRSSVVARKRRPQKHAIASRFANGSRGYRLPREFYIRRPTHFPASRLRGSPSARDWNAPDPLVEIFQGAPRVVPRLGGEIPGVEKKELLEPDGAAAAALRRRNGLVPELPHSAQREIQ